MKCLWLTLADPDPPMNGQFLYSSGLIHAAADAGMDLTVIGFMLPGGAHKDGELAKGIRWCLAAHRPRSRIAGLISALPNLASRTRTHAMRRLVQELLPADDWEVIVFDSFNLGWALPMVREHYSRCDHRPKLVYIAHNHEQSLARKVAANETHPLKRVIKYRDAAKVSSLEQALAENAAVITSNTPEDCAKFRAQWPGKAIEYLPAGYSGEPLEARRITAEIPRRAIIVGSFDWVAKRQSLTNFLVVADPLFARAGIELQVVGQAEESFLEGLRRSCKATIFTGRVPDVTGFMRQARLALVPDEMPGFKLKGLDYVFNRLPILALRDSLPGMPLVDNESARFYDDHAHMAEAVVALIDDFDTLNRLQERAWDACCDQFDWPSLGRRLRAAIMRREGLTSEGLGETRKAAVARADLSS